MIGEHICRWSGQAEEALEIFFWLNGQQIPFGVNWAQLLLLISNNGGGMCSLLSI